MGKPHVLVIPFAAQGHVIPNMELSQRLLKEGFKITFVNSELAQKRTKLSAPEREEGQIRVVSLPEGLEAEPTKVEELIEEINKTEEDKVSCVIADQIFGCVMEVVAKMGIRRAAFHALPAAVLVAGLSIPKLIEDGIIDEDGSPLENQTNHLSSKKPIMDPKTFMWNCVGNLTSQKLCFDFMSKNFKLMKYAEWLICNSTYELEAEIFTLATLAPEIMPLGPLMASNRLGISPGYFLPEDSSSLNWLDTQPANSVIYVAFGSLTIFNKTQFVELALGLELTNRPFLWAVRPGLTKEANDAYPEGFLERVALRGKIVSWAPQQKVLSHPSIACFLTHCGWNSTIESLCNGVPLLCWPYFADQFVSEVYIRDVWKVGLGFKQDDQRLITRTEFKNKVEQLLGDNELKKRVLDLKETTMSSTREGGGYEKNFTKLVAWIKA